MKTAKGLIEHVTKAWLEQWGYVWGTFGLVLTEKRLSDKAIQYRSVKKKKETIRHAWLNRRTADCSGLIKSYIWWDNIKGDPVYNVNTDLGADVMYRLSKTKGKIDMRKFRSFNIPGIGLWKHGHVGVYIGREEVIEAHSTITGVIKTPFRGAGATPWTHWFKIPNIAYEDDYPVMELQDDLNKLGYKLVVDGEYGTLTRRAVKHFQANNNLVIDGIVGPHTRRTLGELIKKLYGDRKDYKEIIKEVSDGQADEWAKAINLAVSVAKDKTNLGVLEIFQHLPILIQKIYYSKKN